MTEQENKMDKIENAEEEVVQEETQSTETEEKDEVEKADDSETEDGQCEAKERVYTEKEVKDMLYSQSLAKRMLNEAAELAARHPSYAGKSAREHGMDIARRIRDLLKSSF